jgi:hypothetical protein
MPKKISGETMSSGADESNEGKAGQQAPVIRTTSNQTELAGRRPTPNIVATFSYLFPSHIDQRKFRMGLQRCSNVIGARLRTHGEPSLKIDIRHRMSRRSEKYKNRTSGPSRRQCCVVQKYRHHQNAHPQTNRRL